jgi:hypothetical protein
MSRSSALDGGRGEEVSGARLRLGHQLLGDLEDARDWQMHNVSDLDPALADAVAHACCLKQLAVVFGIADRRHGLQRQSKPNAEAAKPASFVGRPNVFDPSAECSPVTRKPAKRAIVFDLWGTLVPFPPGSSEAMLKQIATARRSPPWSTCTSSRGQRRF